MVNETAPLADFLRTLRVRAGLTQARLADALGYKQTSVSNIEVGRQSVGVRELAVWLDVCAASADERLEALRLAATPTPPAPDPAVVVQAVVSGPVQA